MTSSDTSEFVKSESEYYLSDRNENGFNHTSAYISLTLSRRLDYLHVSNDNCSNFVYIVQNRTASNTIDFNYRVETSSEIISIMFVKRICAYCILSICERIKDCRIIEARCVTSYQHCMSLFVNSVCAFFLTQFLCQAMCIQRTPKEPN